MPMLQTDSKEIEKQIISQLKLKREEVKSLEEELREIQIIIMKNCDHEWNRGNYPYAPLYCHKCGDER